MSLEQALIDATAAITRLTTVLVSATEAGAVAAPDKAPRTKKATVVEAPAAPLVTVTVTEPTSPATGDPAGTRYFHIPAYNTVYRQLPGMADCTMNGAVEVTADVYLSEKAALEKKFPTAAAVATQQPVTTAPTATAQASVPPAAAPAPTVSADLTFEQVVEKMRALFKKNGDPAVKTVLDKFGAARVPGLLGKASNTEIAAFIDTLLA